MTTTMTSDETAIRATLGKIYESWAAHDADAFADLYTADATVVMPGLLHDGLAALRTSGIRYHLPHRLTVRAEALLAAGRTGAALDAIEEAGVDLLLAGHAHHASVHSAADLVTRAGGALVIQAGTATSVRLREQSQSFNVIDIENGNVTLTVECWCETGFESRDAQKYAYREGRWRIREAEEPAH